MRTAVTLLSCLEHNSHTIVLSWEQQSYYCPVMRTTVILLLCYQDNTHTIALSRGRCNSCDWFPLIILLPCLFFFFTSHWHFVVTWSNWGVLAVLLGDLYTQICCFALAALTYLLFSIDISHIHILFYITASIMVKCLLDESI